MKKKFLCIIAIVVALVLSLSGCKLTFGKEDSSDKEKREIYGMYCGAVCYRESRIELNQDGTFVYYKDSEVEAEGTFEVRSPDDVRDKLEAEEGNEPSATYLLSLIPI